jgi:hypothetical protein
MVSRPSQVPAKQIPENQSNTQPTRGQRVRRKYAEKMLWLSFRAKRKIPPDSKQKTKRVLSAKPALRMTLFGLFPESVKSLSAISTVVLKSLWKRTVRVTYRTRNKALDPVCTTMKQFPDEMIGTRMAKFILDSNSLLIRKKTLGFENKSVSAGQFSILNTTWEDAPALY